VERHTSLLTGTSQGLHWYGIVRAHCHECWRLLQGYAHCCPVLKEELDKTLTWRASQAASVTAYSCNRAGASRRPSSCCFPLPAAAQSAVRYPWFSGREGPPPIRSGADARSAAVRYALAWAECEVHCGAIAVLCIARSHQTGWFRLDSCMDEQGGLLDNSSRCVAKVSMSRCSSKALSRSRCTAVHTSAPAARRLARAAPWRGPLRLRSPACTPCRGYCPSCRKADGALDTPD
jgi:hypothetical protein